MFFEQHQSLRILDLIQWNFKCTTSGLGVTLIYTSILEIPPLIPIYFGTTTSGLCCPDHHNYSFPFSRVPNHTCLFSGKLLFHSSVGKRWVPLSVENFGWDCGETRTRRSEVLTLIYLKTTNSWWGGVVIKQYRRTHLMMSLGQLCVNFCFLLIDRHRVRWRSLLLVKKRGPVKEVTVIVD